MAIQNKRHASIAAGLSGGVGLVLPLAAYAATIPFEGVHDVVRTSGLPFAVGAFAGMGTYALTLRVLAQREEDAAAEAAFADAGWVGAVSQDESAPVGADGYSDHGAHFFGRRGKPEDVPVIARAQGALSDADAWAKIDAELSRGVPFSCDPSTTRDVYRIALDELDRAATVAGSPVAAAAQVPDAASTAMFMAMAGVVPAAAAPSPAPSPASSRPAPSRDEDLDRSYDDDFAAALASLDEPPAVADAHGPAPRVIRVEAPKFDDFDLDEPDFPVDAPAAAPAPAVASASAEPAGAAQPAEEILVVDYSSYSDIFERALAILAEEDAAPVAVSTSPAPAASRHASRDYLKVIDGTASMPRLCAEA